MANKGQHYNHKVSSFSPAWCLRLPTTKDSSPRIKPPSKNKKKNKNQNQSPSQSPIYTTEPSSPRVGCMGQVKRRKPSSCGSLHSSSSSSSSSNSPSNSRGKFDLLLIKRLVSSKILIEEMDPPRPVEKKEARGESSVSLWTRRQCNGGKDLRLQLQSREQVCS